MASHGRLVGARTLVTGASGALGRAFARRLGIAAWEHKDDGEPIRHSEPLQFTALQPSTRSYK